jgi:hypothetical protein
VIDTMPYQPRTKEVKEWTQQALAGGQHGRAVFLHALLTSRREKKMARMMYFLFDVLPQMDQRTIRLFLEELLNAEDVGNPRGYLRIA